MILLRYSFLIIVVSLLNINFSKAQVNTERMRLSSEDDGFSGDLNINLNLQSGNVEVLNAGGGFRLQYDKNVYTLFLISNFQFAKKNSSKFINRGFNHIRYNYSLSEKYKWELFTQYEFDEFTRLFRRNLIGSGIRILLNINKNFAFIFGSTVMFESERIDIKKGSNENKNVENFRWSNYFIYQWRAKNNTFIVNSLYVQPVIDAFDDIRILNEIELQSPITEKLSVSIIFNLRYDSFPPVGVKKTDLQIRNSFSFNF